MRGLSFEKFLSEVYPEGGLSQTVLDDMEICFNEGFDQGFKAGQRLGLPTSGNTVEAPGL